MRGGALAREGVHEPANADGDGEKREEGPQRIAEAIAHVVLREKSKRQGHGHSEENHGLEVSDVHPKLPFSIVCPAPIWKASSTQRKFRTPAVAMSRVP